MKQLPTIIIGIIFGITCMVSMAEADVIYTFSHSVQKTVSIATNGDEPEAWFELAFPLNTEFEDQQYDPEPWDYDTFKDNIESFEITLAGKGDNTDDHKIDFFLDFDPNHSSYTGPIAGYDVEPFTNFTLTLDLLNNSLHYSGSYEHTEVVDFSALFAHLNNIDRLWVGYGCHFKHLETGVSLSAIIPTPEPATLALFGIGLIGLGVLRKRLI
jgi:hypothetical protein